MHSSVAPMCQSCVCLLKTLLVLGTALAGLGRCRKRPRHSKSPDSKFSRKETNGEMYFRRLKIKNLKNLLSIGFPVTYNTCSFLRNWVITVFFCFCFCFCLVVMKFLDSPSKQNHEVYLTNSFVLGHSFYFPGVPD